MIPEEQQRAAEAILAQAEHDPQTGCLAYQGPTNRQGYGTIYLGKQTRGVHRVVLATATGKDLQELSPGLYALHSCDNPPCVNPAHLRWGTQADNMHDMDTRGRRGRPDPTRNATREFVSASEVARRLGVHRATVLRWIAAGKLPGVQAGKNAITLVRISDLNAFLKETSAA